MNNTLKTSFKCALVLIVIAAVAVFALVMAQQFFPEYEPVLDIKKVNKLQSAAPSGVGDDVALAENYYKIIKSDAFDLDDFNSRCGNINNKVLAVYYAEKGDNAGVYITETQCIGYSSQVMVLLTSYNQSGEIIGLVALKTDGDFLLDNAAQYKKLQEAVVGKKLMNKSDITASTGATAKASVKGIEKNLLLSSQLIAELIEGGVK